MIENLLHDFVKFQMTMLHRKTFKNQLENS
jgi:hypothetical protein